MTEKMKEVLGEYKSKLAGVMDIVSDSEPTFDVVFITRENISVIKEIYRDKPQILS
jgi:hypothetical protein